MKNNQPLISVVVPIYNVEKYLERCVDSIISQSYKNLEIILVNDGSTDNSGKICEKYAERDSRIMLINKSNGGLSDARNAGIDIAKGSFITFIDSDDYIHERYIEVLYEFLHMNSSDISTIAYMPFFDNGDKREEEKDNCNIFTKNTVDALEDLMYQKNVRTSAWGKLYKRELFDDIRYPKGKICEDLPITYRLFAKSKKITIITRKMYYYVQRQDSIINSSFDERRMDALKFAEEETAFIKKYFPEIKKAAICREFMEAIYILERLYGLNKKYALQYEDIKNTIKNTRRTVICDKKAPIKCRLVAIFTMVSIKLTQKIMYHKYIRG